MYNDKIEIESPYGHITINYGIHNKHRVRVLDIDGGMESATYIEEELQNELLFEYMYLFDLMFIFVKFFPYILYIFFYLYFIFYLFLSCSNELIATAPSATAVTTCRKLFVLISPAAYIPSILVLQSSPAMT